MKLRCFLFIAIVLCACQSRKELQSRRYFYIDEAGVYISLDNNDIVLSPNPQEILDKNKYLLPHYHTIFFREKGQALLYILHKYWGEVYIRDSMLVKHVREGDIGSVILLAENTPLSFTDSMVGIKLPITPSGLFYNVGNSSDWKKAREIEISELQQMVMPKDAVKETEPFPYVPSINKVDKDIHFFFSDIGPEGRITMNINSDKITFKPTRDTDSFTRWYNYPRLDFFDCAPNLVFFDYINLFEAPECKDFSLGYMSAARRLFSNFHHLKRTRIEFMHSSYDSWEKDVKKLNEKYKADDIFLKISCKGQNRTMEYSDCNLNDIKFHWKKQIHLWEACEKTDSVLTKRFFSPRTFVVLYKFQSSEYILGGPSHLLFEDLPAEIKRIDKSDYYEEEGIPYSPKQGKFCLYNKATGLPEELDRILVIYETPEGPQIWFSGKPGTEPLHRIKKI